ncbi:MAG: PH domain-containing protein [Candidatus Diapherotrites archaeon]|nr:PH domain-containing protein [Candidatus Diapherotrites archaeon]
MPEQSANPTIKKFPLERRKILKKTIAGTFFWGIVFLIVIVIALVIPELQLVSLLVVAACIVLFFVIFIVLYWYQTLYFEKYYYDIKPDFLVIRKGVFAPRETILPYEKLQDVYIDQDIFDRVFTLWDLHVSTATFLSGWEAHIDGVNIENGEAMKKMILEKIKGSKK